MAKKLKTLYAERSLDEVELNRRECTIKHYAEKLMELKESQVVPYSTGRSITSFKVEYKAVLDPKFMECAPYSGGDSISSRSCDIDSQEANELDT